MGGHSDQGLAIRGRFVDDNLSWIAGRYRTLDFRGERERTGDFSR